MIINASDLDFPFGDQPPFVQSDIQAVSFLQFNHLLILDISKQGHNELDIGVFVLEGDLIADVGFEQVF